MSETSECGSGGASRTVAFKSWSYDYDRLLYPGGAAVKRTILTADMGAMVGALDLSRLPLVTKIADVIDARLIAGRSPISAKTTIDKLRTFYSWADEQEVALTLENVTRYFLRWSEHLSQRARLGDINEMTAYGTVAVVSGVLSEALDLEVGLTRQTRHRRNGRNSWRKNAKINIEGAMEFGRMLRDICDALTVRKVRGILPARIEFCGGQVVNHWAGLRGIELLPSSLDDYVPVRKKGRLNPENVAKRDTSNAERKQLINLRVQSEMLIFIAQTGMNLSQVRSLRLGQFSYQSHSDGYLVSRVYKERKQGEVEFEIYAGYRPFFERYLNWIKEIFPAHDELVLFPFIAAEASSKRSLIGTCENLKAVRRFSKILGTQFFTPRLLRKVRINWFARRLGSIDETAEIAQSSKEVLFRNYLQPDPQIAAVEITNFFLEENSLSFSSPGPGVCIFASPSVIKNSPRGAPEPDCISPAGCMFCSYQRDLDSFDHVWCLVSYRRFKTLEMGMYRPPSKRNPIHPASLVVDRVTEKIKVFETGGPVRNAWVTSALQRMREADYHPMWGGFIELIEVSR
ncbi:site-specific integrase [Herbaspirillum frisingense]|uniref:site-specific integrase n=1 Tax=Herbaspirillum frisingense TaxID=92645 RepID=UPI0002F52464|nr:site-specific integrase [Herbaspirillum frisingense]